MTKLVSFDFESTGLVTTRLRSLDKQPYAVELYAERIEIETGEKLAEFQSWFRPGVRMEKEAMNITKLTDEFLSDKPLFIDKIDEIEKFFDDCDIWLGQNIMFDLTILEFEFKRAGRILNKKNKRLIDTVEQTGYIFGYREKLGNIYKSFFNEPLVDSHIASVDAIATTRIFLELYKRGDIIL